MLDTIQYPGPHEPESPTRAATERGSDDVQPWTGPTVDEMGEWSFPASDPPATWTWDVDRPLAD